LEAGSSTQPFPSFARGRGSRLQSIAGGSAGNLIEWYDWYAWASFSLYFAPVFFPSGDRTSQLMSAAAIFAVGFLMRPIGGWLFGRIADRYGRRRSMLISVTMMCAGSLVIACLPTHAQIGAWAPFLLLMCRLFQGLSVGGEYGTTATYMSEVALKGQRGFFSSFQYVTLIGGQLLAVLLMVILEALLTDQQLRDFGWRIPFVVGAVTAVVALLLRRTLHETQSEEALHNKASGTLSNLFRHHWPAFVTVMGYTAGGSLIFYTFTTYMQKYLVNSVGLPIKTTSYVMTVCLFLYMCMQPLFGMLSDRIGRRASMMLFGTLGAIFTVPILTALQHVQSPVMAGLLIVAALAIVSFYTSVAGIVKAEMFPPEVRALGVGLAYAVANAVFGGSAEYVALALKGAGHEQAFFWYVSVMMVVAFLFSMRLPRQAAYLHHDR
jgi:MHS family alpha-ketoglutarate permease-like MFS transporter